MIRGLNTIFFRELVKRLYINILEKRVFVYTMQSTTPAYAKGNEKRQKQKKKGKMKRLLQRLDTAPISGKGAEPHYPLKKPERSNAN